MGKGKGKGKGFYSFIDDSYFAYYFLQWAIAFIIIGAILIIAGAIAGSLYPKGQYKKFSESQQLSAGEGSPNFEEWKLTRSLVTYTFNNFTESAGSLTCTTAGPFVYDLTDTKVSIVFSGDSSNVTYRVSQTKALRADGVNSLYLSLLNPKYIELVKYKQTEKSLFVEAFTSSNFTTNYESFFKNTVPNLIGARYFAENLPATVGNVTINTILPKVYSTSEGLKKAIDEYEQRFTIDKLMKLNCTHCVSASTSIYSSIYAAFFTNPECRGVLSSSENDFKASFIRSFDNLGSTTACALYLQSHGLSNALWAGNGDLALTFLKHMGNLKNLDIFYDLEKPSTGGYCNNIASGAAYFNTTTNFMENICNVFIPTFYPEVRNNLGFNSNELGKRIFCTGERPGDLTLYLGYVPSTVAKFFQTTGLYLASSGTYDDTACNKYITTLSDVEGFIKPTYLGQVTNYDNTLSAAEKTLLTSFFNKHKIGYERYFINLWRGKEVADRYSCASCYIKPLGEVLGNTFPNASVFGNDDRLHNVFFSTNPLAQGYIFSVANPQVTLPFGKTIFDTITSANGILAYTYSLDSTAIKSIFAIDDSQLLALQNYAVSMVNSILQTYIQTPNGLASKQEVGLLQFARAQLACGSKRNSRCSAASEFFGVNLGHNVELGFASYVPSPQVGYPDSFTNSDTTLRDTATATQAQTIFTDLKNPNDVILRVATNLSRKYLHYVFNTFTFDFVSSSDSGLIATRTITEFLEGSNDASVLKFGTGSTINPFRSMDPSVSAPVYIYNIETGVYDANKAYSYNTINGSATLNTYGEQGTLTGLFNPEQLPNGVVKAGLALSIFDNHLSRPFTYTFGSTFEESEEGLSYLTGTADPSDWTNAKYTSTPNYITVPNSVGLEFISPCGAALTDSCALGKDSPANSISVEPDTGLVIKYSTCYVRSISFGGNSFPISASSVSSTARYSVVERKFSRDINPELSSEYQKMVNTTKNNANAILAALIAVGCLFLVVGIVFIVFYFIKRQRENITKAKADLVADPFGENKNKNEVYLRD